MAPPLTATLPTGPPLPVTLPTAQPLSAALPTAPLLPATLPMAQPLSAPLIQPLAPLSTVPLVLLPSDTSITTLHTISPPLANLQLQSNQRANLTAQYYAELKLLVISNINALVQ